MSNKLSLEDSVDVLVSEKAKSNAEYKLLKVQKEGVITKLKEGMRCMKTLEIEIGQSKDTLLDTIDVITCNQSNLIHKLRQVDNLSSILQNLSKSINENTVMIQNNESIVGNKIKSIFNVLYTFKCFIAYSYTWNQTYTLGDKLINTFKIILKLKHILNTFKQYRQENTQILNPSLVQNRVTMHNITKDIDTKKGDNLCLDQNIEKIQSQIKQQEVLMEYLTHLNSQYSTNEPVKSYNLAHYQEELITQYNFKVFQSKWMYQMEYNCLCQCFYQVINSEIEQQHQCIENSCVEYG